MKQRKILPGLFAALGMGVLILDSRTALAGAGDGVELCLRTVVPSLFPFFILSGILVSGLMGSSLPLLRPLGQILGMPKGTEPLLVSGFLGGYPVGAKSVHDAWASGNIRKEDAERMLVFCNNAGPAFLFGMAAPLFSDPVAAWALWGIHMVSAVLAGVLFREEPESDAVLSPGTGLSLSGAMQNAIRVTGQVCGWVVAFRILCSFLERWFLFLLPDWAKAAVTGLLELTNGCVGLNSISSEPVRFLLCSAMLAFGGLCVHMQTVSVTQGLNLKYYFFGKLVQTLFSLLLSMMYLKQLSPLWLFAIPLLAAAKKKGKRGSIPQTIRV